MGKGANRLDAITHQNELLKEQNELLREQNELLKKSSAQSKEDEREIFIENIDRDEMRSGFLVTSHRKKLWNVEIGLINEFARICKKHNIRWFTIGGTLLGAARHKGFIPWDDDVDVIMFRPDYEKFKSVIEKELANQSTFRMWYWFNYRLESDNEVSQSVDPSLPLISKQQQNMYPTWAPFYPLIRLVDSRTTFMMNDARKNVFYSVWLDILCLDPCPPFRDKKLQRIFAAACELLFATVFPERIKEAIENNKKFSMSPDALLKFLE
ncbi:MAG: LicD family protein, partial [Selenomonadaceae bacterium]|nr:LicD family protein [Selenomonadaceae bacterium]